MNPVLASERWRMLNDRFDGRRATFEWADIIGIVVVLAAVALGLLAAHLVQKWLAAKAERPHPWQLERELRRAHRLTWNERRQLQHVAEQTAVQAPMELYVRPELFPAEYGPLREKLFGEAV